MALDSALLKCKSEGLTPDTVRLLRFKPPAVLVGYHQDVEQEVRLDYVNERGIDVNRRLTGGGAIYFDESSVGWEIIASRSSVPARGGLESLFKAMCEGAIKALKILGVEASFRPKNDVEVKGRKISGTGGTELGDAILFQGTLLVDFDVETMVKALRIPIVKLKDKELSSVRERVTWLKRELGYKPNYEEIKRALKEGFEEALNVKLKEGGLTIHEEERLRKELPWFSSPGWVFLDRRIKGDCLLHSSAKKPGGFIKVSLSLDKEANLIKSVLITGDFFVFPRRAIYDLESRLKFAPYDEQEIKKIVYGFFKERSVRMPGISPGDIAKLILEAAGKASYERFGLKEDEINHVYPITERAEEVLFGKCGYLLLPYCAKLVGCKYRRKEGCEKCGACSVGEAYALAEERGLTPVTIQNFEHLIEVLKEIKKSGRGGFVGCCCEAFYMKHREELESIGVPALLVGIDDRTCYDLGKQEEAYRGNFETQTRLKIDVLSKLIKLAGKGGEG